MQFFGIDKIMLQMFSLNLQKLVKKASFLFNEIHLFSFEIATFLITFLFS